MRKYITNTFYNSTPRSIERLPEHLETQEVKHTHGQLAESLWQDGGDGVTRTGLQGGMLLVL